MLLPTKFCCLGVSSCSAITVCRRFVRPHVCDKRCRERFTTVQLRACLRPRSGWLRKVSRLGIIATKPEKGTAAGWWLVVQVAFAFLLIERYS